MSPVHSSTPTRARRALLSSILALFFFNALLDRLTSYYFGITLFTDIFYLLVGLCVLYRCGLILRLGRAHAQAAYAAVFLVTVVGLGLMYGDPMASLFGVKQFFLGAVIVLLFAGEPLSVTTLVRYLLLVQLYAGFQGVYFWTQRFTLPPWDRAYVAALLESWQARNLYQGDLIRPFSTFASFSEYQIVVHILTVGLFLLRRRMTPANRRSTYMLLGVLLFVDALLPDRTPILMAAIILATTGLGESLVHAVRFQPGRLVTGVALALAIAAAFLVVPRWFIMSQNPGLRRLGEGFHFWQAETVTERSTTEWSEALFTIRAHPEGAGPAAVVTTLYPDALTPHSNYFLLAIGYSVAFPLVFLSFLGVTFKRVFRAALARNAWYARVGFCGWGVTLAYLASSAFNASFSSYPGAAYFLLMVWLTSMLDASSPQLPGNPDTQELTSIPVH